VHFRTTTPTDSAPIEHLASDQPSTAYCLLPNDYFLLTAHQSGQLLLLARHRHDTHVVLFRSTNVITHMHVVVRVEAVQHDNNFRTLFTRTARARSPAPRIPATASRQPHRRKVAPR